MTDIINVPEVIRVGSMHPITGTVVPADATNQTITWTIVNAGGTDAGIHGGMLFAAVPGIILVRAAIVNGTAQGTDFEKFFTITISETNTVLSSDQIIPPVKPDEDAAVVAPVVITAGEFTVGPNPVSRSAGAVTFYWTGRELSGGRLFVYDASGNVVNRIVIGGNVGANNYLPLHPVPANRRQIGKWDLSDRRGNPVSKGTYLVRGTLTMSDGTRDLVSVIIGVR